MGLFLLLSIFVIFTDQWQIIAWINLWKSIDSVLGIRTWGHIRRWMEGADESTELPTFGSHCNGDSASCYLPTTAKKMFTALVPDPNESYPEHGKKRGVKIRVKKACNLRQESLKMCWRLPMLPQLQFNCADVVRLIVCSFNRAKQKKHTSLSLSV